MKVKLADREVSIVFGYGTHEAMFGARREATHCILRAVSVPPRRANDPDVILAQACVVPYFKDPPNRELGRKAALTKALAELDRVLPVYSAGAHPAVQAEALKRRRRLFWSVYLSRKPKASSMQSRVLSAPSNPPA